MPNEDILQEIFDQVLEIHRIKFDVDEDEIKQAILEMNYVYSKYGHQKGATRKPVNYNKPAYRCAYVFKYAAIHTALVEDALLKFYRKTNMLLSLFLRNQSINACCLGAGPGTDVLGVVSLIYSLFHGVKSPRFNFTLVDCMSEWKQIFKTVLQVASSDLYGPFGKYISDQVKCSYVCDNLLNAGEKTSTAVESADILTMVKFVSAARPKGTPSMLKRIFTWMKPGAVVLFIDCAGGGFYQKAAQAASECGLTSECEPYRHMHYEKQVFENHNFGHSSLSSVTVAVQMWKKPVPKLCPIGLGTSLDNWIAQPDIYMTCKTIPVTQSSNTTCKTFMTRKTGPVAQSSNTTHKTGPVAQSSSMTRKTVPITQSSNMTCKTIRVTQTCKTAPIPQSSSMRQRTISATNYLRPSNSLSGTRISETVRYSTRLQEQILRSLTYYDHHGLQGNGLDSQHSTYRRPSQTQFIDSWSSFRTPPTTPNGMNYMYKRPDERSSTETRSVFVSKPDQTRVSQEKPSKKDTWCTIL